VNLRDNGDTDGGLLLVHKSHKIFETYLENHPKFGYHWNLVQMGDPLIRDLPIYKINLKAGQACIWSSSTIHCNFIDKKSDLRLAIYVSMMPRDGCSEKDLEKRIKYFETGRITNHDCYGRRFKANGKSDMRGSQVHRAPKSLDFKDLNKEQRSLVGYDE
jgi:ectoine hydroxylase-related dioxygenase (phytanoyl-CoA dioxygenase family)